MKLNRPIRLVIAIYILAILFKLIHLQGAWILIVLASLGLIVVGVYNFSRKENRVVLVYSKLFLILIFAVSSCFSFLHLPYAGVLKFLTLPAFILFLILEEKNPNPKLNQAESNGLYYSRATILFTIVSFILNRLELAGANYCYYLSLITFFVFIIQYRRSYIGLRPTS